MLEVRTHRTVASLVLAAAVYLTGAAPGQAATPLRMSGAITGFVTDAAGVPQMGAAVILFNRQERQFERALTDGRGAFRFLGLTPDLYSIKVTLAAFVPAMKKGILVQPGMASVLNVNLNTLYSSIQFAFPPIENGSLMSDEWKWVLRSASPTRPVLRFNGDAVARSTAPKAPRRAAVFSDTRGVFKVSAGEGSLASGIGNEADLGTAFALATSLYGNNMLQVSGNLGYGSQTGVPTAAFRTSYSRNLGGGNPEVSVTMRQLYLPGRLGAALAGNESALPMLRTMAMSFDDRAELTDRLSVQYGFTLNSVSFLDHLNYASPYARVTYSLGENGDLAFAYTSGDARPDLAGKGQHSADLQHELNTLGLFPRISLRDGRPKIQRGENFELGYTRKMGSRTYQVSTYRENVRNAALSLVAPAGMYTGGDILPDLFTGTSTFNAGDFRSTGYTAAVTQSLGEHLTATVMYGSMGALTASNREIVSDSPDELRNMIRAGRRKAATARVTATAPWTGTHLIASYQVTGDHRWASPGHGYSTASVRQMPGLNLYVRQSIPGLSMLPWRMEATADLRNLLAQGYLSLGIAGGQQLLLVETPRSVRGGLSFIF
ncbi:MAG: TonB-dependent receptor [Candidatus Solibacter sp.]|nr:TonB-dependent receptor [Candidatus Solibacter sp.]